MPTTIRIAAQDGTAYAPNMSEWILVIKSRWWNGKWAKGLMLLALVIFLWTASNFLASSVLADDSYSKPFLITYINTTFFILPFASRLVWKSFREPEELGRWKEEIRSVFRRRYTTLKQEDGDGSSYHDSPVIRSPGVRSVSPFPDVVLGGAMETSQELPPSAISSAEPGLAHYSLKETLRLALEFAPMWFLANYFVAASLQYTTVASSTILTSFSSFFTLIIGHFVGVENCNLKKFLGVLACSAGIIVIAGADLSGQTSDDEHRGDFPEKTTKELAIGNVMALLSAVMYGVYAAFLKKRVPDESRLEMTVFFGLVGILNFLVLLPGFFLLHLTGVETFELPPTGTVVLAVFGNSLASLVSDIAWAKAVVLTSPVVVTVGLSLTIPLSIIGQVVILNQWPTVVYWIGALLVVASFFFIMNEEKKEDVPLEEEVDVERNASVR